MIDIHSHVLPFVDDGSDDLQKSLSMLKDCALQGVTDVILTPHFRGEYKLDPEIIKEKFEAFKVSAKENGIDVNLYLGQEVNVHGDYKKFIADGHVLTMNGTKYILVEFDYTKKTDVTEIIYELVSMGYKPIAAHVERYSYIDLDTVYEIKDLGGLIEVNAESIVGKHKRLYRKKIKEFFKHCLIDFVASDVHFDRVNYMEKARDFVRKKYGSDAEYAVFNYNAEKIIKG